MTVQKNNFALKTHNAWKKLVVKFYWIMAYAGDCLSGAKHKTVAKFGQNNQKQK